MTAALYVSSSELKATLSLSAETYADADIATVISSASRGIEEACGRRFWKDANDATRYYERVAADMVMIDDLATLTSVKTDPDGGGAYSETWTENSDYVFSPQNAAADGVPFVSIHRLADSDYTLPVGPRRIQVIGKFGWPAVPAQVVTATSKIAARLLKGIREAPLGIAGFGMDGAAVRIAQTDPDIRFLLTGLHRGKVGSNGIGIY